MICSIKHKDSWSPEKSHGAGYRDDWITKLQDGKLVWEYEGYKFHENEAAPTTIKYHETKPENWIPTPGIDFILSPGNEHVSCYKTIDNPEIPERPTNPEIPEKPDINIPKEDPKIPSKDGCIVTHRNQYDLKHYIGDKRDWINVGDQGWKYIGYRFHENEERPETIKFHKEEPRNWMPTPEVDFTLLPNNEHISCYPNAPNPKIPEKPEERCCTVSHKNADGSTYMHSIGHENDWNYDPQDGWLYEGFIYHEGERPPAYIHIHKEEPSNWMPIPGQDVILTPDNPKSHCYPPAVTSEIPNKPKKDTSIVPFMHLRMDNFLNDPTIVTLAEEFLAPESYIGEHHIIRFAKFLTDPTLVPADIIYSNGDIPKDDWP